VPHPYGQDHRRRILPEAVQAPGGIVTTSSDVARFLAAHFPRADAQQPGRSVITPGSVATLLSPAPGTEGTIPLQLTERSAYAMGYRTDPLPDGRRLASQADVSDGWTSLMAVIPDAGLGLVVVTNGDANG